MISMNRPKMESRPYEFLLHKHIRVQEIITIKGMVGKGSQLYASPHNHEKSEGSRTLKGVNNGRTEALR